MCIRAGAGRVPRPHPRRSEHGSRAHGCHGRETGAPLLDGEGSLWPGGSAALPGPLHTGASRGQARRALLRPSAGCPGFPRVRRTGATICPSVFTVRTLGTLFGIAWYDLPGCCASKLSKASCSSCFPRLKAKHFREMVPRSPWTP